MIAASMWLDVRPFRCRFPGLLHTVSRFDCGDKSYILQQMRRCPKESRRFTFKLAACFLFRYSPFKVSQQRSCPCDSLQRSRRIRQNAAKNTVHSNIFLYLHCNCSFVICCGTRGFKPIYLPLRDRKTHPCWRLNAIAAFKRPTGI